MSFTWLLAQRTTTPSPGLKPRSFTTWLHSTIQIWTAPVVLDRTKPESEYGKPLKTLDPLEDAAGLFPADEATKRPKVHPGPDRPATPVSVLLSCADAPSTSASPPAVIKMTTAVTSRGLFFQDFITCSPFDFRTTRPEILSHNRHSTPITRYATWRWTRSLYLSRSCPARRSPRS